MELDPYWAANRELTWIDQLLTSIFTCWAGGHILWGDQPCAPVSADQSEISTAGSRPIRGRGEGRGPPLSLSRYTPDTTQRSGGRGPGSDVWPPSSVGLGPWPGLQCCVWLIITSRLIKKAEKVRYVMIRNEKVKVTSEVNAPSVFPFVTQFYCCRVRYGSHVM